MPPAAILPYLQINTNLSGLLFKFLKIILLVLCLFLFCYLEQLEIFQCKGIFNPRNKTAIYSSITRRKLEVIKNVATLLQ